MSVSPKKQSASANSIDAAERDKLIVKWNSTAAEYPENICVHQMFEVQVERTPDYVAVIHENHQLKYSELNQRANMLAHHLVDLGVQSETLVGIFVNRSLEMLVGILGILKAGCAYVPLDPEFPSERISYMMKHSQVPVVLTLDGLADKLPDSNVRILRLDSEWETIEKNSDSNVINRCVPQNLAYVIYTSGSTGNPKGVQVPHSAVVNFLSSMKTEPGITEQDVLLAVTTLSFDIAGLELFLPLTAGAQVSIVSAEIAANGDMLLKAIADSGTTIMQATPVTWRLLVSAGWKGSTKFKCLCGGDVLPRDLMGDLIQRSKSFWNMYGPTETTIWSTCCRLDDPDGPVMIGRPIANTQIYILDSDMEPVPVGEAGELYIGGSGVTRGYLNQEELTARQFLPDPFSKDPNSRIYKTGDLARYLPDGNIVLIGRLDHQIKIRGYRIEVGEIESVLTTFPSVDQVAVMIREDDPGDRRLVAYVVPQSGKQITVDELRSHLRKKLPDYMIPTIFVMLEQMPLTLNRKIDRKSLPVPDRKRPELQQAYIGPTTDLQHILAKTWSQVLRIDRIGIQDNFFELGGNSLLAQRVVSELSRSEEIEISVVDMYQHLTIDNLANNLQAGNKEESLLKGTPGEFEKRRRNRFEDQETAESVAIIGMAGRFPGADTIDELWENLCNGVESITFFTDDEIDPCVDESLRNDPNYVKARGILKDADKFDPLVFGISPREAEVMDPQQRVFLELAWSALEDAGYVSESFDGLTGVFAGMGNNHYYHLNVSTRPDLIKMIGDLQVEVGNEKDHIATRVSHKLNLMGPSISVHTACSTGLVVVDSAFHSLVSHRCDMALAGAVDINIPQNSGQLHQVGGIFTEDGHCRPFDEKTTGTMFCDGAGVVVLKRLQDALADGDTIYATIKGSAINNDGANKASYIGPSVEGQIQVISKAQDCAAVEPDTISYIEAHGTGTPVGDPIEFEGLAQVFRAKTTKTHFCVIGSMKANIGHPTSAAGIAGLIKVALALKHKKIPPQINFDKPNPLCDFENSPFYINTELLDWPEGTSPRRAGVSCFGFGGTNAHAILEEAPQRKASGSSRPVQLLLLSAKTESALDRATKKTSEYLRQHPNTNLADIAYTLQTGRKLFNQRLFVVCKDAEEGATALESQNPDSVGKRTLRSGEPSIAFMFPGQGAQYVNMGLNLYQREPVFRNTVDQCAEILKPYLGCDLRRLLYPAEGDAETAAKSLRETFYTQPAIFTIEYALSKLWASWGIHPQSMIGHSIGEFVCACLAGVFSLEDALLLVATRGRLMQNLPEGSMLSVRLPADEIEKLLDDDLAVAAVNGPSLCVVSGPSPSVLKLQNTLEEKKIACRHLHTSHAFHSAMMDTIVEPYAEYVKKVKLSAPRIPFVSTVTSEWVTKELVTDPMYWAKHLRSTVRFAEGVHELLQDKDRVLLEVGPRTTTATLARQQMKDRKAQVAISSLSDTAENNAEWIAVLKAIGQLWLCGVSVDWKSYYSRETRHKVSAPTYPFERKRYWIEPAYYPGDAERKVSTVGIEQPVVGPTLEETADNDSKELSNERVMPLLREILSDASGMDLRDIDDTTTFAEMGMDSLLLTQVSVNIQSKFNVTVAFRQLLEELSTPKLLSEFIDKNTSFRLVPDQSIEQETSAERKKSQTSPKAADVFSGQNFIVNSGNNNSQEKIILQQLEIINKLVAILEKSGQIPKDLVFTTAENLDPNGQKIVQKLTETTPNNNDKSKKQLKIMNHETPPVPGARLGRDPEGHPAWYVTDPEHPGKYLMVKEM